MARLLELAEAAVEAAQRGGAEWADAVCARYRDISVSVEKSSLRECETALEEGLGVRAYFRGGRGTATVVGPTLAEARRCGRQAAEMARATHPDPAFVALPEAQPVVEVEGLFDEQVAALPVAQVVEWCRQGIEEAHSVCDRAVVSGGVELTWGEKALASSTGIRAETQGSRLTVDFSAVIRNGDDVGMYYEFDLARRLADFVPEGVAAAATREALRFLNARHLATARLPVVLGPLSANHLVASLIAGANAENVQRNRSFLVGRAGEQVAAPVLTVVEEPLVPAGINSQAVDGEGVPKQRRNLVDRGVLTGYLHNSYTANKAGVENTGHAARGGYGAQVGIGVSNVTVQPGELDTEELLREVGEGLYINEAGLAADSVSGDLSATVDFGFKIEGGELAYPVQNTMIGGNLLELVSRLVAVSADFREEPGWIMPSLVLGDVQVSGGG